MVELSFLDLIRLALGLALLLIGVYMASNNLFSRLAWVLFLFLLSLSWYVVFVDTVMPFFYGDLNTTLLLDKLTNWTYLLPIPLLLHISVIVSGSEGKAVNRISLPLLYTITMLLLAASISTTFVLDHEVIKYQSPELGYFVGRGVMFPIIALVTVWSAGISTTNYFRRLKRDDIKAGRIKFLLPAISSFLYIIIGPLLVFLYMFSRSYELIFYLTAPLLIAPIIPLAVSIFFFRLLSDVEDIFNFKEFIYKGSALTLLMVPYLVLFYLFLKPVTREEFLMIVSASYLIIITHGFYDWLATFIRDLIAQKGFSLITDNETANLIKNFHAPEKIEINSLTRFKAVKGKAKDRRLVDGAQKLTTEAIEYFKQPDFPRRTKQNLKYQLLKMLTLDEAEEGQILWELGFEGYPVKIMAGENKTRKPLFKIESMSDYTATSRNAYIILKKEAIHDLAWRLSYLEKTSR